MDRFITRGKNTRITDANARTTETDAESEECCSNDAAASAKRKFRQEWLQKFSWLKLENGSAFCVTCQKEITNHLSHLARHENNRLHISNTEKRRNQIKMDEFINKKSSVLSEQVRQAELTLVMFCIMHNLPFRLLDFLPNILCVCCSDSFIAKSLKCHRTKSTYLAEVLGNKAKDNIVSVLRKSMFSLIIDEATDFSCRKSLVLVVRYFDSATRSIKDRFLQLIELDKSNSEFIYQTIKSFFINQSIPINNLIGLATDGASTMAGNLNGLKTKLSVDTELFNIKCTCHSLHLCASYACKKRPQQIEELCRNVYKFFAYSPKRIKDFKEFQDFCEVKPHKILGISLTRWLALESVIARIVEQWEPLQLYFLSCCLEVSGIKSKHLANLMGNPELKAYMLFLTYILKIINNLNKEFQAEYVRLPYLFQQMETNFKLIMSNYICDEYIKSVQNVQPIDIQKTEKYLPICDIVIGSKAEKYLQSDLFCNEQRLSIKLNIRNFYIEILKQLSSRFDFNRQDIKCLKILTPSNIFSDSTESFSSVVNEFGHLINCDVDTIITQWRLLRLRSSDFKNYTNIETFWEKVSVVKNGLGEYAFGELAQFVFELLSLPHSSAAAERKFFDLSLIKTKLRNKLEFKSLNNIMLAKELCTGHNDESHVWRESKIF